MHAIETQILDDSQHCLYCSAPLMCKLKGCTAPQAPSWSSTDYGGHWKLLHYAAKRFFSPLLISADYNKVSNIVSVYLTSDINQALRGAPYTEAALYSVILSTC